MVAVSRLFLDNVQHIQASWLTQGLKLGQTALRFGADDMGSIMIEENVVSAAGANTCANEKDLRYQIREAREQPPFWDGPHTQPLARWLPGVTWESGYRPLEVYNPVTGRFEGRKKR